MTIGLRTAVGARQDAITLAAVVSSPNADGGIDETTTPLDPPLVMGRVERATQGALERLGAETALSSTTQIVRIPFHPTVTTAARVTWTDRVGRAHVANVTGVSYDTDCTETALVCEELVG